MERKRKLPARAAARQETVAKKRNMTPPVDKEKSPPPNATRAPPEPVVEEAPPPPLPAPLPKSIQPGKPLPTVEEAQAETLPSKEFQSIQESGVMVESIRRSRAKWTTDFIFEKYWTKPSKRKGVVTEDANNPPKDSMTKLGQVTIFVHPHVFDATLYAVKDPKPPATTPVSRPILQYGPAGGSMPPPTPAKAAPEATKSTPAPKPTASVANTPGTTRVQTTTVLKQERESPKPATPTHAPPRESPKPPPSSVGPVRATPTAPPTAPTAGSVPRPNTTSSYYQRPGTGTNQPAQAPPPRPSAASSQANGNVIQALGHRAAQDESLKRLMQRVAAGEADKTELEAFQRVLDQVNEEFKQPPPDKLYVDSRSIKYFATEMKNILRIVYWSNPNQKSANLVPPKGSDPLMMILLRSALDNPKLKAAIHRIADGVHEIGDGNLVKGILDGHHKKLMMEKMKKQQKERPQTPTAATPALQNGLPSTGGASTSAPQGQVAAPNQSSLKSKGLPPAPKLPDISAVVVEFGGAGDRYLFPKYSILEYQGPQQVVASFLLVRRSSKAEYGGDKEQDYYEPITMRITALHPPTSRFLENLARVVAPHEEVRRYMDDVMASMTRAQYVLLAWRLMREKEGEKDDDEVHGAAAANPNDGSTPKTLAAATDSMGLVKPGVLWAAKATPPPENGPPRKKLPTAIETDEQSYQKLVQSAAAKETEEQ